MRTHSTKNRSSRIQGLNTNVWHTTRAQNRRMLVVEDDTQLWPIIDRVGLSIDSYLDIDFVETTNEAITRMMDETRFDAVLLDNCLPNPGDGASLRAPIEILQPWACVAMMSGRPETNVNDWTFLPKPFTPWEFRGFLRRLIMPGTT